MGFKIFGSIISIFLISCAIESASHRILAIFPFQSRSHQMMFDALIKGLVDRGHQMDVMTVYPMKKPLKNYTVVVNLEGKQESLVNQWNVKFASELGDDTLPIIALPFGNGLCEYLGLPEMQAIIKNPPQDPPYDLVIVESFGANCFIGLGHVLNVPVIMASSTVPLPWLETSLGQVQYPAFVPAFFTSHKHPMSFFDRVLNTVKTYSNNIRYRYYTEAVQNAQMRKYIDPDIPPLRELEKNVVLALVNSWHSLNPIQPVTPGVIGVAGLHVDANYVPLPKIGVFGRSERLMLEGMVNTRKCIVVWRRSRTGDIELQFWWIVNKLQTFTYNRISLKNLAIWIENSIEFLIISFWAILLKNYAACL